MNPQKHTMTVLAKIARWKPDIIFENLARKRKIQMRSFSADSHVVAMKDGENVFIDKAYVDFRNLRTLDAAEPVCLLPFFHKNAGVSPSEYRNSLGTSYAPKDSF